MLVAQSVGALTSGLCHAERQSAEPRYVHKFLCVSFTLYCISLYLFITIMLVSASRRAEKGKVTLKGIVVVVNK